MTTEMIRRWSMQGAACNSDGEERSAEQIRGALAPRCKPPAEEHPRMRGAGDDEWKPLLTGIEGDGERTDDASE